jgi:putative flippase GtrA
VFKPEEDLIFKKRFAIYVSTNLFSYVINLIALHLMVNYTHHDPFISQLIIILPLIMLNFAFAKYWSLKKQELAFNATGAQ